jgi:hypothetical protein
LFLFNPFESLRREQLVNHFAKNAAITTKVGLLKNLRSLKWFEDVDMDTFYPRGYDLSDFDEMFDFFGTNDRGDLLTSLVLMTVGVCTTVLFYLKYGW